MTFSVPNLLYCAATLLGVNLLWVCAAADNNEEAIEIAKKPLNPELIGLSDRLLKVDTKKNQNPIVGCWQEVRDPTHLIRFEADRMSDFFNGLSFYAVQFDQQSLSLNNWWFGTGCNAQYELLSDSALRLTSAGVKKLYKRLDTVPESLELKSAPLGKKNDLSAERMREIRTEYGMRMVNDQMVRMNGVEHIVAAKLNRTDADNTAALKKLIAEVGWLDVERFGEQASAAAILIVLHSGDIPLMAAALPRIEVDAAAQRIDRGLYAKLYDRLALNLGRKQRFGTQHTVMLVNGVVAGKKKTQPIEDVAKVDQYRAEVGLPPLPADEKNQ